MAEGLVGSKPNKDALVIGCQEMDPLIVIGIIISLSFFVFVFLQFRKISFKELTPTPQREKIFCFVGISDPTPSIRYTDSICTTQNGSIGVRGDPEQCILERGL